LAAIILDAYFPKAFQARYPLKNLPAWGLSELYDVIAKVSPEDVAAWQGLVNQRNPAVSNMLLMGMLQSMLTDRCKLVVHRVSSQADGYALVVGKRPKLKPATPDEAIPSNALTIQEGGRMVPIHNVDYPVLTFYQTSMASLAAELVTMTPIPVIDRTGLEGKFDFTLLRLDVRGGPEDSWDFQSLGLRLEPIKIPTEDIVIDHIERPSEN
jgi:uncharacterized protein (TIGR03435 family)